MIKRVTNGINNCQISDELKVVLAGYLGLVCFASFSLLSKNGYSLEANDAYVGPPKRLIFTDGQFQSTEEDTEGHEGKQ